MTAASADSHRVALRTNLAFAAICLVTALAYARSFDTPFQFDDNGQVIGNRAVVEPTVERVLSYGRARLLPVATLVLNYHFAGEVTFTYHVVNFAVHLLATFAVFHLALALCRTPPLRNTWIAGEAIAFATAAALFFACHPIQVQAVTYIVQRTAAMAAMFYVACVLFYVRARNAQLGLGPGRPRVAYAVSTVMGLCAFLSKENTASLPVAVALAELTFYPGGRGRQRLLRLAPFAVLAMLIPLAWRLLGNTPGYRPDRASPWMQQTQDLVRLLVFRANPTEQVSPFDYLITQAVVIPRYLKLVVLPWGFNVDHDVSIASGLSASALAGLTLLAGLFAMGLVALRRAPVVGFGLLWTFVALSVESSFLPIRDPMVEHRMYLAMPGVALVAGWAFARALRRFRAAALATGMVIAVGLAMLTAVRNEVWRSPVTLWQDALAKSPNKPRTHANLATALYRAERDAEAIEYFCSALRLDPDYRVARDNLDNLLEERANLALEAGEEVKMRSVVGPDGRLEFKLLDPCSAGDPRP